MQINRMTVYIIKRARSKYWGRKRKLANIKIINNIRIKIVTKVKRKLLMKVNLVY